MNIRLLKFGASDDFQQLWDAFVLQDECASAGHLSANFHLAAAMGVQNHSLLALDEKGNVIGLLPLYEIHSRKLRVFRFLELSSGVQFPAHPLLDAKLSKRQLKNTLALLLKEAENIASGCRADLIRIGYPAMIGTQTALSRYQYYPLREFGYSDENIVGRIIDLQSDLDHIFALLKPTCRNMIRRAERAGCSVRAVSDRQEWLKCRNLAVQTLGGLVDSEKVHEACWDYFIAPGHARAYGITRPRSDEPTNVVVTVGLGKNWYYWKSYNTRKESTEGANNLALWEAIADTKKSGGSYFELGSMEFDDPKQQAISAFKSSFGGTASYFLRGARYQRPIRKLALELLLALYKRHRPLTHADQHESIE